MISFPFCSPVTEATKPAQQLSTPSTSGDINVTVLITNLLSGYDKRLRPNFGGEEKNLCLLFFFEAVYYFVSYERVTHRWFALLVISLTCSR